MQFDFQLYFKSFLILILQLKKYWIYMFFIIKYFLIIIPIQMINKYDFGFELIRINKYHL